MTNSFLHRDGNVEAMDSASMINNWIPSYTRESSSGFYSTNLQTEHFTDRKLFLTGEVTDQLANDFVSEMLYLAKTNEPVDIYINSPGGSVNAGLVIVDMIKHYRDKMPINLYCVGNAASMGAVILSTGEKGRRFIMPHSEVMIHEPLVPGGMGGSASSIQKRSDMLMETKQILAQILADNTGKSLKDINKAIAYDNFMSADEAIAFGIVDAIKIPE